MYRCPILPPPPPALNTGANPRAPLVTDMATMYHDAWTTPILPLKSLVFISRPRDYAA